MKARLAHGIAHAAPWGVSLDGLLAAEIWADQKAGKRDRGEDVAALSADVDPVDLDLPLARCELSGGDLWHWAATCAYPEKPVDHPVVRYWTGRPDHAALGDLVADLPGVVSERQGPYRSRSMPLLVTSTDTVTWQCVGDDARIMAILQGIAAIGKNVVKAKVEFSGGKWRRSTSPLPGRQDISMPMAASVDLLRTDACTEPRWQPAAEDPLVCGRHTCMPFAGTYSTCRSRALCKRGYG